MSYFKYTLVASASIHDFLVSLFAAIETIIIESHWLRSYLTIVKKNKFNVATSLSNNKILGFVKILKVFAREKINLTQKLQFLLKSEKMLWKMKKMLITSIFFFSYNVFKFGIVQ